MKPHLFKYKGQWHVYCDSATSTEFVLACAYADYLNEKATH